MAVDFPNTPTVGQTFAASNGVTYQWSGAIWMPLSGTQVLIIGDVPPVSPVNGQLWWNSTLGTLFIWYTDPNSSQWVMASPSPVSTVQPLIKRVTVFTASGTYTPNTFMVYAEARGWGAGGAGGSAASPATSIGIQGGGGAAGSWAIKSFTKALAGASQAVTIGAAAAQPAAGNVNGGVGGDTSLGVLLVAKGGSGGGGASVAVGFGTGGLGVVAGNVGDETGPGMSGGTGSNIAAGAGQAATAVGGSAIPIGSGGRSTAGASAQANGEAAIGFASGGSGAQSFSTGAATRGGVGTGGYLAIDEYCTQ